MNANGKFDTARGCSWRVSERGSGTEDGAMRRKAAGIRLTFQAPRQTGGGEVNKEASDKHAVFTLLLALGGEKARKQEVLMGSECEWRKSDMLRKQIKSN